MRIALKKTRLKSTPWLVCLALAGCSESGWTPQEGTLNVPNAENPTEPVDIGAALPAPTPTISEISADLPDNLYSLENNNALLTGPVFGSGEHFGTDIVQTIPVEYSHDASGLKASVGFVFRDWQNTDKTNAIVPIENTTDTHQCIRHSNVTVGLSDQSTLEGHTLRLYGNAYDIAPNAEERILTDCIAPNSSVFGYMNLASKGDLDPRYGTISNLVVAETDIHHYFAEDTPDATAIAPLKPISYSIVNEGEIEILIENQDPSRSISVLAAKIFALDQNGIPIHFLRGSTGAIRAGGSATMKVDTTSFTGSASTVRVILTHLSAR